MASIQSITQELILRLNIDTKGANLTIEQLRKEVQKFQTSVIKQSNILDGTVDQQRESLQEVTRLFAQLNQIVTDTDGPRNSLKGINREYQFIEESLGRLKQRAEDLKDAILLPEISSEQYSQLEAELKAVNLEISELEKRQKNQDAATKAALKTQEQQLKLQQQYAEAVEFSSKVQQGATLTLADYESGLKSLQAAQKTVPTTSTEFTELGQSIDFVQSEIKRLKIEAQTQPLRELLADLELTGDTTQFTVEELKQLEKELRRQVEASDRSSKAGQRLAERERNIRGRRVA